MAICRIDRLPMAAFCHILMREIDQYQRGGGMQTNDTKISVRMPRGVHEAIVEMANRNRRSVNAQILVMLEQVVEKYRASQESAV
jgi:hypothetical protein